MDDSGGPRRTGDAEDEPVGQVRRLVAEANRGRRNSIERSAALAAVHERVSDARGDTQSPASTRRGVFLAALDVQHDQTGSPQLARALNSTRDHAGERRYSLGMNPAGTRIDAPTLLRSLQDRAPALPAVVTGRTMRGEWEQWRKQFQQACENGDFSKATEATRSLENYTQVFDSGNDELAAVARRISSLAVLVHKLAVAAGVVAADSYDIQSFGGASTDGA